MLAASRFRKLLSFLRIMMMNVLPLLIWVTDKDEMPCSLPAKDIRFLVLGVDKAQTGFEQMLEEAESEKLTVDGVIADITNYEAPYLYNFVVIDRVFHMLQNDEIRNAVLEKSSNAVSKAGFILIADTPKHKSLICDYFKSVPKVWKIIEMKRTSFLPKR